jgi:hypothetical protein
VSCIEQVIVCKYGKEDTSPNKTIFKVLWADRGKTWIPMDILPLHNLCGDLLRMAFAIR